MVSSPRFGKIKDWMLGAVPHELGVWGLWPQRVQGSALAFSRPNSVPAAPAKCLRRWATA